MRWDNSEVYAVFAIAAAGALWRAASLRGDLAKEWQSRAEDAEDGLADRATIEAVSLQGEISAMIGSGSETLPRLATVDPRPLVDRTEEFRQTLVVGARIPRDLERLLRLVPAMAVTALIFLLGLAALFTDTSELLPSSVLKVAGIVLLAASVLAGIVLVGVYFLLNQRLSGAEIRSRENLG